MRRLWIWTLPLAIAGTAFWLSSRSTLPFGINLSLEHPRDWFAHALEFGTLAFALDVAVRRTWPGLPLYRRHLTVFLVVSAFGLSDELHQSFTPGRDCDVLDWLVDTLGGALGLVLTCATFFTTRRIGYQAWRRGRARRPDPGAPLILVADPHWSEDLTGLEAATLAHPEADWLFLGDLFDVWVGVPGMETPLQGRFLAWAAERRRQGRWVGLWLGNREFFLDGLSDHFDLMGEGIGGRLPDEGLAWEHGDLINTRDWRYRLWNLVSRSSVMWVVARLLPRAAAQALARRLHRAMATTNLAYKLAFPREDFRRAAAENAPDTFITGHFHTYEREANGLALPWAHGGDFMVWRNGSVEPLTS